MRLEQHVLTYFSLAIALVAGMGVLFQIFSPSSKIGAEKIVPQVSPEFSEILTSSFSQNPPRQAIVLINLKDNQGNPLNCQSQAPKAAKVIILPTRSFGTLDSEVKIQSVSSDCKSKWVLGIEVEESFPLSFMVKVLDENGNFTTLEKESQIGFPQTS